MTIVENNAVQNRLGTQLAAFAPCSVVSSASHPSGIIDLQRFHLPNMQAVYYRDRTGRQPVKEFVQALDPIAEDAVDWAIELLNELRNTDPPLAFPYSSQVAGDLRELRCHAGRRHIRLLYRRSEKLFILLHAFDKRSARVPASYVAVAEQRWADFRTRMDEVPRRGPRPIGTDAP